MRLPIILMIFVCLSFNAKSQYRSESNVDSIALHMVTQAETKMRHQINKIYTLYKQDTLTLRKLRLAQLAWTKFRDAELATRYPSEEGNYGHRRTCYLSYKAELTLLRLESLNIWITGMAEGDVCQGSVRNSE